jgi:hypothetical protein
MHRACGAVANAAIANRSRHLQSASEALGEGMLWGHGRSYFGCVGDGGVDSAATSMAACKRVQAA